MCYSQLKFDSNSSCFALRDDFVFQDKTNKLALEKINISAFKHILFFEAVSFELHSWKTVYFFERIIWTQTKGSFLACCCGLVVSFSFVTVNVYLKPHWPNRVRRLVIWYFKQGILVNISVPCTFGKYGHWIDSLFFTLNVSFLTWTNSVKQYQKQRKLIINWGKGFVFGYKK